jgi:hypothetical protein
MEYFSYGVIALATVLGLLIVFHLAAKVDLWLDRQAQRKRDRQTIFKRQLDRSS